MKESTNEVDKNTAVSVIRTIPTVKKRWLAMKDKNLHDCIHVSLLAVLRFRDLCNMETPQP